MTFSWEIDDIEALHHIIKRELKCLGIRISKKKDGGRIHQFHDKVSAPLFGGALNACSLVKDGSSQCHVPRFLVECTKFLENHLDQEGIFRISGSQSRQRELQRNLENGSCIPSDANQADVCSLFKLFFRNLPEALITPRLQSAFLKCLQLDNEAEQRWGVLTTCYLLPAINQQVLRFVMLFLRRVALCSEHNRMDTSNLAKVFTPNFMGAAPQTDKKNPEKLLRLQTAVVQVLIENAKLIGEVPDWMLERARSVGKNSSRDNLDRLTSEDELDKSDDNLDDSSRQPRRRRKSGSSSFQVLVKDLGHSLGILKTGSSMDSLLSGGSDVTHNVESPKIMKRKACEEIGSAFSAVKRKAMLRQMTVDPQYSKPGLNLHRTQHGSGTPVTPLCSTKPALGETDAITADGETLFRLGTPSIKFADDSFGGFSPSKPNQFQETPKKKLKKLKQLSTKKLKRRSMAFTLDSESQTVKSSKGLKTPTTKSKDNGVGWRLANASPPEGLDTLKLFDIPSRPSPTFGTPRRDRKHMKTPSSPARLLTGSPQLSQSKNQPDYSVTVTPIRQGRVRSTSSESSPQVVIIDTHSVRKESPKVVIVDTSVSEQNVIDEYAKNQKLHASKLIGSKLDVEAKKPVVSVADSTRQMISAATKLYESMSKDEDSAAPESHEKDGFNRSDQKQSGLTPSVSQMSLSSVLSSVSALSQRSEFSVELAMEYTSKDADAENLSCMPQVVDCGRGTSGMDLSDGGRDSVTRKCNGDDDNSHSVPINEELLHKKVESHIGLSPPMLAKSELIKSDSLDSGKGHSMEDLKHAGVDDKENDEEVPRVVDEVDADMVDVDDGIGPVDTKMNECGESTNEQTHEDTKVVVEQVMNDNEFANSEKGSKDDGVGTIQQTRNDEVNDSQDKDSKKSAPEKGDGCIKRVHFDGEDKGDIKENVSHADLEEKVGNNGENMDSDESSLRSLPKSISNDTSDCGLQDMINAALKSDLKSSSKENKTQTTLICHDETVMGDNHNASIVKANILLFNSMSASQEELHHIPSRATQQKHWPYRHGNDAMDTGKRPLTPLTKSVSMDSGICNLQIPERDRRTTKGGLNESYMTAVSSKRKDPMVTSVSMEDVSTPTQDHNESYIQAVKMRPPISQSLQDISTPKTTSRSPRKQTAKAARSTTDLPTPKCRRAPVTPRSIRRRRPVSQIQKDAFQETESLKRVTRQKVFESGESNTEGLTPPVRPLGDNNSPQLRRVRRPPPMDRRRAMPLTPVHLAHQTKIRTPGSRKSVTVKYGSPVKPVKRLTKSPSPRRSRQSSTPECQSRTPKIYPRSPKNPLCHASPGSKKQTTAVPVRIKDEWEL